MKLNAKQIAVLYLIIFQIEESEYNRDKQRRMLEPLDNLLIQNNEPPSEKVIFDEDGCPLNASGAVELWWLHNIGWVLGDGFEDTLAAQISKLYIEQGQQSPNIWDVNGDELMHQFLNKINLEL